MSCRHATIFALACLTTACAAAASSPAALRFSVPEGGVLNEFYRLGPVAAHLVLTPGPAPRLVIAFPAGNSGAALWFDAPAAALSWSPDISVDTARRELPDGSVLLGVSAEIGATGGPARLREAIVSSVRVIRDYEDTAELPPQLRVRPQVSEGKVVWQRRRLDGAPGYYLSIETLSGELRADEAGRIELAPGAGDRLRLRVTALTGDEPLTPVAGEELLTGAAAPDLRLQRMLEFLSYEQKFLAGSWRFDTYFGRDTLMSLRLLAPVLQPRAFEIGLGAVLERLSAAGEVAHEEEIGEYAALRRMRQGEPPSDKPLFDYKMIDDDFMLAVVAAHYLLDSPAGPSRAPAFLSRRAASGATYGALLVRNLLLIVDRTTAFARELDWRHLVALKPGEYAGNWRDSEDGLGGGRYPYDVNGVLAPAALDAIARLHVSGVLKPYLEPGADSELARAAAMAQVWLQEAPPLFDVVLPSAAARAAVGDYARRISVDPSPALTALAEDTVRFRAISLDARGRPIPVLNSDEALALLLLEPASAEVEQIVETLTRAFPAGLLTDVGLLVADPAYALEELEPAFDRSHYHGTVIWSWQQALLAAGIERQLGRDDLDASARAALEAARSRLRAAIAAADAVRGSELWSWSQTDGVYRVEPFGQREEHETESNAAQLWSTVHLAQPAK